MSCLWGDLRRFEGDFLSRECFGQKDWQERKGAGG